MTQLLQRFQMGHDSTAGTVTAHPGSHWLGHCEIAITSTRHTPLHHQSIVQWHHL